MLSPHRFQQLTQALDRRSNLLQSASRAGFKSIPRQLFEINRLRFGGNRLTALEYPYHEFVDAILPKKIDYASMVRSRIPFNSDGRYSRLTLFSSETSYLFKNVLRTWIKSEAHSESIRQRLSKRPMRVIDAFDALDKTHRGYLTELEVIHILIISSVTYLTLIASTPLVKSSNFLLIVMIPTRTAASLLESLQTKLSLNPQLDSDSIRSLL